MKSSNTTLGLDTLKLRKQTGSEQKRQKFGLTGGLTSTADRYNTGMKKSQPLLKLDSNQNNKENQSEMEAPPKKDTTARMIPKSMSLYHKADKRMEFGKNEEQRHNQTGKDSTAKKNSKADENSVAKFYPRTGIEQPFLIDPP